MTAATLNLRITPRRMLAAREAADYVGLPMKRFARECGVTPVAMPSGMRLWDIRDLDRWIDSLKSGDPSSDDAILSQLD